LSVMNMLGLSSSVHFAHIACYRKILAFALHTSPMSVQAVPVPGGYKYRDLAALHVGGVSNLRQ
jgi:hypothetical protein